MPGYACPDIVSAAVHAGVHPVLVDLEPECPYMSLQGIRAAISEHTIAIVALNFLGIPERMRDLRMIADDHNLILIEDSAQWYPDCEAPISTSFDGDLVVLSFGKGKPVSLLGGGALLVKKNTLVDHIHPLANPVASLPSVVKLRAILPIYNCVISPLAYWLLEALPFIELGATRYKALTEIQALDNTRLRLLAENIRRYQALDLTNQQQIQATVGRYNHYLLDLPAVCNSYRGQRLLRYPILLPTATTRNKVLTALTDAGVGASSFYPVTLPQIPGVAELVSSHVPLRHAADFASRLITLPTHQGVDSRHIEVIDATIKHCAETC